MHNRHMLSFVIPCYNEARQIVHVINGIHQELAGTGIDYEIIVMDNKSTDRSADLARSAGANVFPSTAVTVAQVRNDAIHHVRGNILIFLDGDVIIEQPWGLEIHNVIRNLEANSKLITGSHCSAPGHSKKLLAAWYDGIENDSRNTHLGTGHMILRRDFFTSAGMFDGRLSSGEDYEFCAKAKTMGGEIIHNSKLKACHMGYPSNLFDFVKRESWHGLSDFRDLPAILNSKVALLTLIFIAIHLLLTYAIMIRSPSVGGILLLILPLMILASTVYKFGISSLPILLRRSIVMYFYFWGRTWAALLALGGSIRQPKLDN